MACKMIHARTNDMIRPGMPKMINMHNNCWHISSMRADTNADKGNQTTLSDLSKDLKDSWWPTYPVECRSNGWLAQWQELRRPRRPEQHWETLLLADYYFHFLSSYPSSWLASWLSSWLSQRSSWLPPQNHQGLLPWGCVASCAMQDPAHEMMPLVMLFVSNGRSLGEEKDQHAALKTRMSRGASGYALARQESCHKMH